MLRMIQLAGAVAVAACSAFAFQGTAGGWISLFDGKTLAGWEDPAKETPPGDAWVVEDGCIKSVANAKIREDLFTTATFGDFELVFDWKISPKGNSGVKYRVQDRAVLIKGKTKPNAKRFEETVDYELAHRLGSRSAIKPGDSIEEYVIAFEYQLIDNKGHPDALNGPDRSTGAVYSMVAPSADASKPAGEWNTSRIVLRGNHVEHWLNGKKVIDTNLDSPAILAGLEKRWGKESQVYQLLAKQPKKETPLGLQNHNDVAWFRNIKIRKLK